MRAATFVLLLALGACHSQATRDQINQMEANGEIGSDKTATPAAAPARSPAVSIDRKDDLVDFHAGWPSEAASIAVLDTRFRDESDRALKELVEGATADREMRAKDGIEFHGYTSKIDYAVAGASDRLLSLDAPFDTYTGGAHGMHGTVAVLWDKVSGKDVGFAGLFETPDMAFASMSKAWCAAIDEERAKRRGSDYAIQGADDPFNQCPSLKEIDVIPIDKDGDGRFEALRVTADPYVAGPYAEGDYEVFLPVTSSIIRAMKADYRPSFED